jgi:pentatricopeptide repeat protein
VLHALADAGHSDLALGGLRQMCDQPSNKRYLITQHTSLRARSDRHVCGMEPTLATYDGLLRSCIRRQEAEGASRLVDEMRTHGLCPRPNTTDALNEIAVGVHFRVWARYERLVGLMLRGIRWARARRVAMAHRDGPHAQPAEPQLESLSASAAAAVHAARAHVEARGHAAQVLAA